MPKPPAHNLARELRRNTALLSPQTPPFVTQTFSLLYRRISACSASPRTHDFHESPNMQVDNGTRVTRPSQAASKAISHQMPYEFKHTRRVEFSDTDMAGIMHFSNFFRFMEATETAFMRSLGLSVVLANRGL